MAEATSDSAVVGAADEPWRSEQRTYLVDLSIFSRDALFRACYQYTDRCYLFLHTDRGSSVAITFRCRAPNARIDDIVGSFANELINQQLRVDIARETKGLRELIVARAFADAPFEVSPDANHP